VFGVTKKKKKINASPLFCPPVRINWVVKTFMLGIIFPDGLKSRAGKI
jgi:hypothetical protein